MRFFVPLLLLCCITCQLSAQENSMYKSLPVGNHPVGFRIVTITDPSRVSLPEQNYLGEKNEGDRTKKITMHIWYPAIAGTGTRNITYGEYASHQLLNSTDEPLSESQKSTQLTARRGAAQRWFGKIEDEHWKKLVETPMLARANAEPAKGNFPLLIGMLRPLSTSHTNEILASQGYVVAMVRFSNQFQAPLNNTVEIPDMQQAMLYAKNNFTINESKIGTFGFSGSGFTQILLAMYDYRIKAVADLESGLFMEGLYQQLSSSNYYHPSRMQIPFMHLFSRDLSKEEKYLKDFEKEMKYSERYRVILNQPGLHHWDFASEGYTACLFLNNRGSNQSNIRQSFELANLYLLNFFNAKLKGETGAQKFIQQKSTVSGYSPSLWDLTVFPAGKPAPNRNELEYIIRNKGIDWAMSILRETLPNDSITDIRQGRQLNNLGSVFFNEKKHKEAIALFKVNTELHPEDANLWDSLAEGYEAAGDIANMKSISKKVVELLTAKQALTEAEKSLKSAAEERLKK